MIKPPKDNKPITLFQYCVKKAKDLGELANVHNHPKWASLLFSYEKSGDTRLELMSLVKQEYAIYFVGKLKYGFDVEKLEEHFPAWLGIKKEEEPLPDDPIERLFVQMQRALAKEKKEQLNPYNRESYSVQEITFVKEQNHSYIHKATLKADDGSDPHFSEGIAFVLKTRDGRYTCEAIEYDYVNGQLLFTANSHIYKTGTCSISIDNTFILEGLISKLKNIEAGQLNKELPIMKLITNQSRKVAPVLHDGVSDSISRKLDASQRKAFNAALDKDITLIWGPPGTGKSFTLAAIIDALYTIQNERTVVCCVSNVAVDQLVNKVVDIIEREGRTVAPGNLYRAGRSMDDRVLSTNFLFPTDEKTIELRKEIKANKIALDLMKQNKQDMTDEAIALKAANKDLRARLKEHTDYLVLHSKVVFSTISNFVLSSTLNNSHFDNLIVDEASMLATPSLIALGCKIAKRIILVGDFQQLSPIALVPEPLLNNSIFKLCQIDIDHTKHPALHLLLNQRRSNKKIVDLFNDVFYGNKLTAKIEEKHRVTMIPPFSGNIIALKDVRDGAVRFTKGGTRQNKNFALAVIGLVKKFAQSRNHSFTVGIITPYKGQVSLIRALLSEIKLREEFAQRVRVGTIHTFQGSECDIIIYDMVDCAVLEDGKRANIGKIYGGEEGEQLLNVALSRARHKLIVVADSSYIANIPGNKITARSRKIFELINKYRFTRE